MVICIIVLFITIRENKLRLEVVDSEEPEEATEGVAEPKSSAA